MSPFDFGYVFSTPDDIFGPYSTVYFVVFTIGMVIANYFYFYGKYRFKNNLLRYTFINRASRNAAIAFSLGFFFFLCRIAKLQPFNARLFLDLALLLLVFYIVRGIGYLMRTYPKAKVEWQSQRERLVRRNEPRATTTSTIRPATQTSRPTRVTRTGVLAGGDGIQAVTSTPVTSNEIQPAMRQPVLSERGLKRRERKRSKR